MEELRFESAATGMVVARRGCVDTTRDMVAMDYKAFLEPDAEYGGYVVICRRGTVRDSERPVVDSGASGRSTPLLCRSR